MKENSAATLYGQKLRESRVFQDFQEAFENATGLPLQLHAAGEPAGGLKARPRANAFCSLMARNNQSCAACHAESTGFTGPSDTINAGEAVFPVRDIGARLNVRFLIEGSVRREGDRLKVMAQLVRTDDGYHVWSQSFEQNVRDVLAVQDEIARAVVDGVKSRIGLTAPLVAESSACP